jgi:uncharacterized protein
VLDHAYHLLLELIPVFLIAIVASSLLDYYLPDSYINKISSIKNKNLGIYISAFIGSLIPICTCGMIPLAIKLHQKGLDWRYLASFLVAGNACSITALILTSSISWELTLIRLFASIVFGIFVTNILIIFSKTKKDFQLELLVSAKPNCCDHEGHSHEKTSLKKKLFEDTVEISKNFLPWILLAVVIATLMNHYLNWDPDSISGFLLTNKFISALIASLIGFPFYFCAGADVPISAEFLNRSVSLGTVISFMLASPGVNLTSLLVYQKAIGLQKAILLILVSIFVASILGYIINLSI